MLLSPRSVMCCKMFFPHPPAWLPLVILCHGADPAAGLQISLPPASCSSVLSFEFSQTPVGSASCPWVLPHKTQVSKVCRGWCASHGGRGSGKGVFADETPQSSHLAQHHPALGLRRAGRKRPSSESSAHKGRQYSMRAQPNKLSLTFSSFIDVYAAN